MDDDHAIPELRFGRYEIVELVGAGGMGRVFRARDPKLDREVAVKLLRDVSSEAQARMLREARTMAALSHPNVVPVYDVDVDGDDVFIAMELVRGDDLRNWMRAGPHPWREVARVFAAAGRGLEAAHAAGLVHRDFKPANVMLGDDGRVRVMDFGLARTAPGDPSARAEDSSASGTSRDPLDDGITREGDIVGTPQYMAPELETGATTTPAGDQYAFAIAFYEALYDQSPFAGPTRERTSMQKWSEEIRPAPHDSSAPRVLYDVCTRGLRADPRDRFPSMGALVGAIERSLDPSSRRSYLAAVVVVGALAGTAAWIVAAGDRCAAADEMLGEVWNEGRRTQLQSVLEPGVDGVDDKVDAYFQAWIEARHRLCEGEAPPNVDSYRACLDARLRQGAAVIDVLLQVDPDAADRAPAAVDALPRIDACADEERRDRLEPPPELAAETLLARTILSRVSTLRKLGDYDEAARALAEELPAELLFCPVRAEAQLLGGIVADGQGKYAAAIEALEQAYDTADSCAHHDAAFEAARFLMVIEGHRGGHIEAADNWYGHARSHLAHIEEPVLDEIVLLYSHGPVIYGAGRTDEGMRLAERAVELLDALEEPHPGLRAEALANRGSLYGWEARDEDAHADFEESLRLYEVVHGPEHHKVAMGMMNVSASLRTLGRFDEAAEMAARGVELMRRTLGPEHPWLIKGLTSLGQVLDETGRLEEGETKVREALSIAERAFGPDHFELVHPLRTLAAMESERGKDEAAMATLQRVVDLQARLGQRNDSYAMDLREMSEQLVAAGRFDEAARRLDEVMEIIVELQGPEHPDMGQALATRAYLFHEQKQFARAEQDFVQAVKLLEQLADGGSYQLGEVLHAYAEMLIDAGRPNDARPILERALAIYDATKAWPEVTQRARELLATLPT